MPVVFAAGAAPAFLTDAVVLIVAGALIAYISFRLKLVPIVGFLIAGVLIGPNALGLVEDEALVAATAEIGVILLLFTIGIEFSLEKLASIQKLIFAGGTAQVGLSIIATTAILAAFGVDWKVGVFTGMLVALSSTAIVLKLLADNSETSSEPGQVGLGLLIFQDLAIVVMVLLIPTLGASGGDGGAGGVFLALAKAALIIVAVLVIARRIMPKILELVAKTCSPELFLLTIIAICFGTAYLTSLAGVSLSLGAFLAGLMVSESRFSQHALSETLPLQILFQRDVLCIGRDAARCRFPGAQFTGRDCRDRRGARDQDRDDMDKRQDSEILDTGSRGLCVDACADRRVFVRARACGPRGRIVTRGCRRSRVADFYRRDRRAHGDDAVPDAGRERAVG